MFLIRDTRYWILDGVPQFSAIALIRQPGERTIKNRVSSILCILTIYIKFIHL